jgi:hypothetical protein
LTDDKRRFTLRVSMGALVIAALLGVVGWLSTGNESGRMLVVISLLMFGLTYYVLETQFSGRG